MQIEGSCCSVQKSALSALVCEDFIWCFKEGYWIGLFVARPRFHWRMVVEGYYILLFVARLGFLWHEQTSSASMYVMVSVFMATSDGTMPFLCFCFWTLLSVFVLHLHGCCWVHEEIKCPWRDWFIFSHQLASFLNWSLWPSAWFGFSVMLLKLYNLPIWFRFTSFRLLKGFPMQLICSPYAADVCWIWAL